ncbi:YggS family pyridoxal phosphate enzyme [Mycolicibacterium cyprinidarum]|uniref:Pyridoxal phosphate homeostasis protein n=1 Tax=Mycolicibacterium cyprinidarum TaxID=2860311 RepID=A0ABQ4VCI1_9MYCO|nr:YggS family pyridoxal phosphate enzyme [Mycolicibacterium sp. NGTWS0302]GJF16993.1 YggS family pyridoxal phosphate enzyme [Mycolicibacterium sp. NGTWS1803]GJF19708.1 YggS family pyridoxal phosphate enzyme [Mycolicibacterium sp. NGTWSNA01]
MTSGRERELGQALAAVRKRLARAAEAAGRDVADIELLPVTKFFPVSDLLVLRRLGCLAFGESRDQEGARKAAEVSAVPGCDSLRWHMVGRIQRNKARSVARWAYAAHALDSAKVITALDRAVAEALGSGSRTEPLRAYLQISLDGDESRGGVDVAATGRIDELCGAVDEARGLQFVGLMAIPPRGAEPGAAFARLQQERERVQACYQQRLELSAGMSGDLESAVEHGSTCVRVGTALMGSRPLTSPEVVTPVTPSSQTPDTADISATLNTSNTSAPQEGSSR